MLAVKPGDVETACRALADTGSRVPVLSIAAGITLRRLEACLAPGTPVVRAMPNTPALIGAGAAAVAAGRAADESDLAWAEEILGAVGRVVRVDEALLDAVTGLSGSGPAYVFLVAEALVDAGVLAGLPRPVATTLAVQTLLGSARLLDESPEGAGSPEGGGHVSGRHHSRGAPGARGRRRAVCVPGGGPRRHRAQSRARTGLRARTRGQAPAGGCPTRPTSNGRIQ